MKIALLFFVPVLLFLSSCSKKVETLHKEQKTLHINFNNDPSVCDPRKAPDPISCMLSFLAFDGLTKLEPDGSISLALAKCIEISKSRRKYIFHLKEAFWSDGTPITAHDFEYSWKRILDPYFNTINAYFLYPIKNAAAAKAGVASLEDVGIKALDDNTLFVKLESPTPYFLEMLSFCIFFPIPKHIEQENQSWALSSSFPVVSSGPFIIEKWKHNDCITLKKNPHYWKASATRLEKIQIDIIPSELTAFKLFELGELDWIGSFVSPIPYTEIIRHSDDPNLVIKDITGTTLCYFNTKSFPLDNPNIRKALSYSINRKKIIDNVLNGRSEIAHGLIPPVLKKNKVTKFLPDGSNELAKHYFEIAMKQLHVDPGHFPKLKLMTLNTELNKSLAEVLQQQWKKALNLDVEIEFLDLQIILNNLANKNYHICLLSILSQYFDPQNFLERFLDSNNVKNYTAWENQEFNELVSVANEHRNKKQRLHLIEKAESTLLHEMPIAPIFHQVSYHLKAPNLCGVKISPIGHIDFSEAYFESPQESY